MVGLPAEGRMESNEDLTLSSVLITNDERLSEIAPF
jgi:hypothetical protein